MEFDQATELIGDIQGVLDLLGPGVRPATEPERTFSRFGRPERVLSRGCGRVVDVRSGSFAARSVTVISVSGTPQYRTRSNLVGKACPGPLEAFVT